MHLLPKEMRHLTVLPKKPKYKGDLKYENLDDVRKLTRRFEKFCEINERNVYHWTLTLKNGQRLEMYPTALAAGGSQHCWYFPDADELLKFVELSAAPSRSVAPDQEEFDVLEDF